ncbi:MAG: TRAP transporter substrate-binding protein [Pseudomonadales bacterium]|nr:TRAP transporter substrate-binding protein [Pseudomonadales bacterium]
MAQGSISHRAAGVAVAVAFAAGLLGSLAIRPAEPGGRAGPADRSGGSVAADTFRWRMPVAFATNLPALGDNALYVRDTLRAVSGDAMLLEIHEPGEVVPVFSITEAVGDRKVPAGYTWLGYDQGRIPASPLLGAVPFGMEPWEFSAWWFESGGRELGESLYHGYGVHPLFCGITGPETAGWFRRRIDTLDDLKGLKIRFAGLGGKVMQRAGASVTMLPGGEIFQALEKGAIDATEYALPVVDQLLGFNRVAPYNYYPGWHQPATAFHLVVNLAVWEALEPATQALIEAVCTAGVTRNLARSEALQGSVLAGFTGQGVNALQIAPEILEALARISDEVLAEEARADRAFAEILASQQAFRADYAGWKARAYLPRDF